MSAEGKIAKPTADERDLVAVLRRELAAARSDPSRNVVDRISTLERAIAAALDLLDRLTRRA